MWWNGGNEGIGGSWMYFEGWGRVLVRNEVEVEVVVEEGRRKNFSQRKMILKTLCATKICARRGLTGLALLFVRVNIPIFVRRLRWSTVKVR
jgi:hypothetical protein